MRNVLLESSLLLVFSENVRTCSYETLKLNVNDDILSNFFFKSCFKFANNWTPICHLEDVSVLDSAWHGTHYTSGQFLHESY